MVCPVAVSTAAAAVWLLAVLGPGLSFAAEDNSDPGFSLCSHCFYRQTPPQGASAGPLLHPNCHTLPGGRTFATLTKPTCDTAVYYAFHLSHGSSDGEEREDLLNEDKITVAVPALLRGGGGMSHPVSHTDSPLQYWDSTVATLVRSSITPHCSTLGGDLYILTGSGGLGAAEHGDEGCQTKLLWSAVCCAVPEGKSGFSMGLIREAGKGDRQVSVTELEKVLGVEELFSEGCGGTDETVGVVVDLHSDGHVGKTENLEASAEGLREEEEADEVTQGNSAGPVKAVRNNEEQKHPGAVTSESPESSAEYVTVDEEETDTGSSSTLVYILSTAVYILTAPLRPVVSTVTQLPGQVTYVLQEDIGVLCAIPGDSFSLFHLLTSDLLSWTGSAAEMLLGLGETIFSSAYFCSSSMMGALISCCHTGVTGIGTLAGDTVGIFGDTLENVWWVTKLFGGRLWEQSEDYVETVMSELGGQARSVGGGFGKLVQRSGNGVGNVFRLGEGLIMGMVNMVTGGVKEAFGQESE